MKTTWIVLIVSAAFLSNSCGATTEGNGVTAPSPTQKSLEDIVLFDGYSPAEGSVLTPGTPYSFSLTISGEPAAGGIALIRDDGVDLLAACTGVGSGVGGTTHFTFSSKADTGIVKFWVRGHKINAALIAMRGSGFSTRCPFVLMGADNRATERVAWDKVEYQKEIALNWLYE